MDENTARRAAVEFLGGQVQESGFRVGVPISRTRLGHRHEPGTLPGARLGVPVGGFDRVVNVDVGALVGASQDRGVLGQGDHEPGGDRVELADVPEREAPQERAQRGRGPDTGEQPAHPTMAQQVQVIDRVRPCDHPGDQCWDLQVRVHTTDGPQSQRVRDEVSQPRPLRQRHRRSQTRARREIGIVERRGDGRETMRNSHRVDAFLSG